MRDKNKKIKFFAFTILEEIYIIYRGSGGIFPYWRTVRCFFTISEEELEKCRYNYKGKDTYAFVMSDRYIMALYTYCLSARKAVALENIEPEGLSEAELAMVKLERVREVLFQTLLLDDVKFEDDKMYEKYHSIIEKIDVENLEIVAFQVTSNSNDCADIKKYGLRNLQWVLSNDTELNRFLDENHIRFDIEKKLMHIDDISYDVDFEKYRNLDVISKRGEQLYRIGHKLYYDFQINAFLFCKDIYDYSTIHETPEFFYTLSSLNEVTKGIDKKWKKICKSYVVKFTSKLKDFAYFTFYENEREYMDDKQNNWSALRRLLISKAVESAFGDSASQIFAYMKPDTVIAPENIIEYVPAEKWRKDVLKYFGKE